MTETFNRRQLLARTAGGVVLLASALLAGAAGSATKPTTGPATAPAEGRSLFDGRSLENWKLADFGGHGDVHVDDGALVLPAGEGVTGVAWTGGALPKVSYEISLDAKRVDGNDFFCGLTFPVKDSYASLIVGGWGGTVCGLSSLDGEDAAHNETATNRTFKKGQWYHVRLRVLPEKIQAWVDDEKIVDVTTTGKQVATRVDINLCKPLGLASWQTTAAVRNIRLREVEGVEP